MPHRFTSKPYPYDHGVLFSTEVAGAVRQVFVAPHLLKHHAFAALTDRLRVEFVIDHASLLIKAANAKAAADPTDGMIILDMGDL